MRKHIENIHGVFEKITRIPPTFGHSIRQGSISEFDTNAKDIQAPKAPTDKSLEWLSNLTKLLPYEKLAASFQASHNDRCKIAMYEREIATIRSHNWIIPNSEIQGLTGYICRRCNQIAFDGCT